MKILEGVRPLNILDLPDELLRRIFDYVNGDTGLSACELYFDDRIKTNVSDIKTLRLTCRRFYETSSHLLMYYTTVGMTRESLAHLDEVSRHPLISKGIRAIKVSLGPFYDSILADDIKVFAAFRASKMRRNIERWEQGIDNQLTRPIPIEVYQGVIATAASFVRSLEEVAARGIDRIPFDHFRIAEAHTKYRQLYEEHKDFSSSFAQAITSAMVRMPTATWLKINDEKSYIYPGSTMAHMLSEALEGADSLQDFMVSPVRWEDVRKFRLGPPPFNLVGELLLSIQRLNIRLAGFYIQFPPPVASSSDTATTHEPALLRAAANQLKSIVFKPQIGWDDSWTERAPDEWADFTSFLRTILQTKSLQRINLNFYFMGNNPPPLLSMASPLLSYTWPNLETLYFHGPFHYEELKAVVEPLDRNVSLRWSGYLMSGSWIDVLDLLRGRNSLVQRLGTTFDGQEYDLMTHAERRFLFEEDEDEEYDYGYPGSRVNQYIQGWLPSNPVRDWEMGELNMPEPSEGADSPGDEELSETEWW